MRPVAFGQEMVQQGNFSLGFGVLFTQRHALLINENS